MIKPEAIRLAKRISVVAGCVGALGGLSYAATSAVVRSDETARRLLTVEQSVREFERNMYRLEGKVDALLFHFRVPNPAPTPPAWE